MIRLIMVLIGIAALSVSAAEIKVSSADEIARAMEKAQPGDVLVLNDGTYRDQEINFAGNGTEGKPITLRAQTPGKVLLEGESRLLIKGDHLIASGLFFGDAKSEKSIADIRGIENRLTDSAIVAPNRGGQWIHFTGGQRNRMDHCYIEGHGPKDVRLQVEVEDTPNEDQIDHNYFGPRPALGENGGETMRIGYSHQSMKISRTVVEYNLFDRCDGEIEIISSKSCENVYRFNTFMNSEGTLTLRHGNRCRVEGNFFFGNGHDGKPSGGIRVIGEDHTIINNYFQDISGINGAVINLTAGIPNSPLVGYWQIKKALVAYNTFVNNPCPCINLSTGYEQRGRTLLPENVTIANNLMLGKQTFVIGKEGQGFQWMGNLAEGAEIGAAPAAGMRTADLQMSKGAGGILRPREKSAARGAAEGEFPAVTIDIDGQPRPKEKCDVGCDQASDAPVTNKPLTAADVGPSWKVPGASQASAASADEHLAAANEAPEVKPLMLQNENVTVRFDPQTRKLIVRGKGGREAESVALCPQIVNAGGLQMRMIDDHRDPFGTTQAIEIRTEGGNQRFWLGGDKPFVFTRATLLQSGAADGDMKTIVPLAIKLSSPGEGLRLLGSDGPAAAEKGKISYVFIAAANQDSNAGCVAGWITHERSSGIVDAHLDDGKLLITAKADYGKSPLSLSNSAEGETFAFGFFPDARLGLEQFADETAAFNHITLPPPPCGYSTWYHAHALDQARMAKLAAFCKEQHLDEYGLNFLQIDDQWQAARRDFTGHNPKGPYPDGMKKTADTIKSAGLFAGLWLTPFGWNSKEGPLASHTDWFVHRADGSVYDVKWAGDCLDMSNPGARAFLHEVIARMTHDWGYKLLKIDGLWSGMACMILYPSPEYRDDHLGDAVFYDKKKTNIEVYRDGLKLVREAAGNDTFLLGCNIAQNMRTMGASIGLVDAMRVGPDIKADWSAVVRCAKPATWLYFWNGRVWHNDPDCLMLRDPLTLDNARAWGSFIALSGQLNLVSEWLPDLPPEKLEVYKRTIPNHRLHLARPVDLFDSELPRIWQLTAGEGDERRDVIGLFNWDAKSPARISLDLAQLHVPGGSYVGFDYWGNQFLTSVEPRQEIELPPGSCRVIALRRSSDQPQPISTSRHISQGLLDLTYVRWHNEKKTLTGRSDIVAGDPYELRLDAAGMQASGVELAEVDNAPVAAASFKQDGRLVRVTIQSPQTRRLEWEVHFAGK